MKVSESAFGSYEIDQNKLSRCLFQKAIPKTGIGQEFYHELPAKKHYKGC